MDFKMVVTFSLLSIIAGLCMGFFEKSKYAAVTYTLGFLGFSLITPSLLLLKVNDILSFIIGGCSFVASSYVARWVYPESYLTYKINDKSKRWKIFRK